MNQREIKFRAWDKKNKRIYEVWELTLEEDGSVDVLRMWGMNGRQMFKFGGEIELMQYTGLKDKNGKEIYEGDIVKTNNKRIFSIEIPDIFYKLADGSWMTETDFGVIGNIYENPELLERGRI